MNEAMERERERMRPERPWFMAREVVARRAKGGPIELSVECHLAATPCSEKCAQFEWLTPGADHRHYRVRMHCTGHTVPVRQLEEKKSQI